MKPSDRAKFSKLWQATWATYGKDVTADMLSVAFAALQDHDLEAIAAALSAHVRSSRFAPVPADVVLALAPKPDDDGRPGPEVAWAMYPKSEADTVVWTEEMAQAFGIANPLSDDPIAARMAFKEAYTAAVTQARAERRPAKWQVSFGHDPSGREAAVVDAVAKGRLSRDQALVLLPGSERLLALPVNPEGQRRITAAAKLLMV